MWMMASTPFNPALHMMKRVYRVLRVTTLPPGRSFTCPICSYKGRFLDVHRAYGRRLDAQCPWCGALERQRLQYCVVRSMLATHDFSGKAAIHFAPEEPMRRFLRPQFASYTTADLTRTDVDHHVDLRSLPFEDASFDFVYASHVLEHIDDERKAIAEISRILRPQGLAILPVPILGESTVEYPYPIAAEEYHVRAPGLDYFRRLAEHFSNVEIKTSEDYPEEYQTCSFEDRVGFSGDLFPYRPKQFGKRHVDYVPLCWR
jgi:SAM-dependent methyltransferase